jgi:hypothetical protein
MEGRAFNAPSSDLGRLFVGNVRSPGEAGEVLDGDRLRGSSGGLQFGWHQCASRKPLTSAAVMAWEWVCDLEEVGQYQFL